MQNNMIHTAIGPMSNSWKLGYLGDIVEIHDKKRIPIKEEDRNKIRGEYPYCGANGIIDYINQYIFDGEYVLLAEDGGHWGRFESSAYIMVGKFWVNNHAHILLAKKGKVNNHYLKYILNFLELSSYITGSTRGKLNQKELRSIRLPVPPLVEQRGIVEVLGTVDECIRLTDAVIERAEELKRGLMQQLLTRGIGHTEYKETPLGEIPKTWDAVKYEQANERIFVGIATSTTQHMSDKGIPLIRNQNIKEGIIDLTELIYITKRFSEANNSKMIKENDILTVRTGYTGQSCKVEKEMEGWQTFTTIISRPNLREFDPDFVVIFLNSPLARNQILSLEAGLAQKNLNVRWISKLTMPKPPLLEQQKISQMIKITYDYRETIINEKKHLILIKQGLMQLLFTGKIRVELKGDGLHRIGDDREANN